MIYSLVGVGIIAAFVTSLAIFARADIGRHGRPRGRGTRSDPDG